MSAIAAGVARAGGEWVLTLDCDLQDDPREIPRIYETGRSGHDVVLYLLEQREQPLWRWAGGKIHGALLGWVTKSPLAGRHGNFCMVRRSVVQRFLASPQVGFMYSSALVRLARNLGTVQGTRRSRYEGRSSYSVSALVATSLRNLAGYWERFVRLYLLPPAALVAVGFVVYVFLPLPRSDPTRSVILAVLSMMLFVDLTAGCLVYGLYRRLRCCPFAVARSVRSSRVTEDEG